MSSQPLVPPRPQRAQAAPAMPTQSIPIVPARPTRKTDPSPGRDMARSPLNELPPSLTNGHTFYGQANLSASDLPRRPPSVQAMPLIGDEGSEYASFDQLPAEAKVRHADVPMLAPTAAFASSTAKSRISAVTHTGKADDDSDSLARTTSREQYNPLRSKTSFNRSTPSLHGRPPSIQSERDTEQGIPVIGMTVPMYPNAGDVQAPSPGPTQAVFPGGVGFFNDGTQRAHNRRRSSRQEFGPPGSYGLHGHPGQEPSDKFEREWIAKHPDVAAREGYNVYGGLTPRPASALTSDQLNRLVREGDDIGMGTSRSAVGTPDQEIGFLASEMYTAHITSAKPSPSADSHARSASGNVPDSPLRKSAFPFNKPANYESEDDNIFHVDPPERRSNKWTGGGEADGTIDLGPKAGNTSEAGGWFDERGQGIPILASDETMKRPGSAYLQPAINPEMSRDDEEGTYSRRGSVQQGGSRPSSRPVSMHGGPLHRFISHEEHAGSGVGTPLEDVEEYEPLFPEDDKDASKALLKEKLKARPSLAAHHFPSQDIWEDTPASLQYTTDVDEPEPEHTTVPASAVFETPEQETARREQNPHGMTSDAKTFAKPHFRGAQHEQAERPGVHRFPSRDVWEDTPDNAYQYTTVSSSQDELSHPEERPTTSAMPQSQDDGHARASTGLAQLMKPTVSGRPQSRSKLSQDITSEIAPEEDDRAREVPDLGVTSSKPVVPARPTRLAQTEQTDDASSPPKVKPAVPARPAGGKLAGLRANFMNDLNSRLQLGPQAPPTRSVDTEAEPVPESKEPLVDARKSRAKGPARRKAPSAAPEAFGFSFSSVSLWHIDEEDELKVHSSATTTAPAQPVEAESGYTAEAIGHSGDVPDPTVSPAVVSEADSIKPELQQALSQAEAPAASAEEMQAKLAAHHESLAPLPTKEVSAAGPLDVPAAENGGVAIREGAEVGRTD